MRAGHQKRADDVNSVLAELRRGGPRTSRELASSRGWTTMRASQILMQLYNDGIGIVDRVRLTQVRLEYLYSIKHIEVANAG